MYSATNSTPEPVFVTQEKKFLIVPIFFRKQIEKYIESTLRSGMGFIFGEDRENFSIIKKVWTVKEQRSSAYSDLLKQAKDIAAKSGMKLLGLFYSGDQTATYSADVFSQDQLTSVELVIENGTTKQWIPHPRPQYAGTIVEQKIII